mmetsp:Transcript_16778/g.67703  ORF Transcript_16778/g.67703 Transcript_16778/m.67703 type:complete len:257 (-) Transcript_16778:76-846(-)
MYRDPSPTRRRRRPVDPAQGESPRRTRTSSSNGFFGAVATVCVAALLVDRNTRSKASALSVVPLKNAALDRVGLAARPVDIAASCERGITVDVDRGVEIAATTVSSSSSSTGPTARRREVGWVECYRVTSAPETALATNLLVDVAARRRGVATRLMRAVEHVARAWGARDVVLSAQPAHEPSWRLYTEKLGYAVCGDNDDGYSPIQTRLDRRSASCMVRKRLSAPPRCPTPSGDDDDPDGLAAAQAALVLLEQEGD